MKKINHKSGSVLIIVLGFILVFTLLGFSTLYLATLQNEAAEKRTASTKAFWLAEAGLQKGLWEYNHNECQGFFRVSDGTACTGGCKNCGDKKLKDKITDYGDFDVELDSANTTLTSIGSFPSRAGGHPLFVQRKVQIQGGYPLNYAIFAKEKIVTGTNFTVDSYDSREGYDESDTEDDIGDIGSNGKSSGIITFGNIATIYGHLSTGPGGTVDHGSIYEPPDSPPTHENNVYLPSVTIPENFSTLETLTIAKDETIIISEQDHKYEAINFEGNGTLEFKGTVRLYLYSTTTALNAPGNLTFVLKPDADVTIYTNGQFLVKSNFTVQNPGNPSQFQLFSAYKVNDPDNPGIYIKNNATVTGTIYAPDTNIDIKNKNCTFFGAMVGNSVILGNNAKIHYDEALKNQGNSSNRKWRELPI